MNGKVYAFASGFARLQSFFFLSSIFFFESESVFGFFSSCTPRLRHNIYCLRSGRSGARLLGGTSFHYSLFTSIISHAFRIRCFTVSHQCCAQIQRALYTQTLPFGPVSVSVFGELSSTALTSFHTKEKKKPRRPGESAGPQKHRTADELTSLILLSFYCWFSFRFPHNRRHTEERGRKGHTQNASRAVTLYRYYSARGRRGSLR